MSAARGPPIFPKLIAKAALDFQTAQTGHAPSSVAVVLGGDTLVVTLHGALTPAEQELARSSEGAFKVQEYHRRLFQSSCATLQEEIRRITGMAVRESTAEVEPATGAVVHAFRTGTMVQIFLLKDLIGEVGGSHANGSS